MNTNNVPTSTVTRDTRTLDRETGNIYESVVILSKRANQIGTSIKEELNEKLADFIQVSDSLDEVFENREQIEISKYYERMPKPTSIAIDDFLDEKYTYRDRDDVSEDSLA